MEGISARLYYLQYAIRRIMMQKYDIVRLKDGADKYADSGIQGGEIGTVVDTLGARRLVMFFNKKDHGDYACVWTNDDDLLYLNGMPEEVKKWIDDIVRREDFSAHKAFRRSDIKEYDQVEVVAEKEAYARQGVHKGMRGVVMTDHAIDGKWYVIFSEDGTGRDIADCVIDGDDLKRIP
jgi:hypothetical protein